MFDTLGDPVKLWDVKLLRQPRNALFRSWSAFALVERLNVNISMKLLKAGVQAMILGLHDVLIVVRHSDTTPPDWKKGLPILIWKGKRDHLDFNNYYSVTLVCVLDKVLSHLLLMWIRSHQPIYQRHEWYGFKPSKSTTDLILVLCVLVEHRREF